ncbi:MAG TPA: cobyric acid synthase CobQ, partial [Amaricoccus sp.]|nr:cobyric acid synthase CobQ [Amaricoccus sp.]
TAPTGGPIRIAVPILPRIANFDDLDPLAADPAVTLLRTWPGTPLPPADLILLPGSKSTIADLSALRDAGFDIDIAAHLRQGRHVLGLCAGYQMLGREIADPAGIEGPPGRTPGLGHLDVTTVITAEKRLAPVTGATPDGRPFHGYEMHMGATTGPDTARPFATLADDGTGGRPDGATSASGLVQGTYVHGLFADDAQRSAWLARLGGPPSSLAYETQVEATLDALARHLEAHLDLDALLTIARG